MEIEERICSEGHGWIDPRYLVIHSTADPGADADTLCRYWESGQTSYQVHYCVDWEGRCYHCVPDDAKAWHCGNGNSVSIGIEVCEPSDDGDLADSWRYAVEAASQILVSHGWDVSQMVSHHWMSDNYGGSDHTDPDEFFERCGHTWDEFVEAVEGFGGESEEDDLQQSDIDAIVAAVAENIKTDDAFKASIAHSVWNYKNADVNGDADAYKLLTDVHEEATGTYGTVHKVWNYKNVKINGDRDVYQMVTDLCEAVEELVDKSEG